jgi:hypothetical protein
MKLCTIQIRNVSYQFRKIVFLPCFWLILLLLVLVSCKTVHQPDSELSRANKLFNSGEFSSLKNLTDSVRNAGSLPKTLDSLQEISERIKRDFRLTEADVKSRLAKYYPELNPSQMAEWENKLRLEMRLIDGEKRYFSQAVSNLFRMDDVAKARKQEVDGCQADSLKLFCLKHTEKIISETAVSGKPENPVSMKLTYTIEVKPNAVPDGETIRCWMPFPRVGNARQKNIKLLKSDPEMAVVAPESDFQRAVYMEKKAVKDQPTLFQIELELESSAQYFDLKPEEIKPYNTESAVYKEFTSERAPQIVFSPKIAALAKRILQGESNPLKKVQKIYNWINDTIRWASALEYSIMPDIPGYVLKTGHGDCGMQTLLFMTLARSQGIPVKWQSGWMLHPREVNLHDWSEVFYEGIGWVPLDQSFGLQNSTDEKVRNFYRSGIDSYRMIVNDDYSRELTPKKKYLRSEPYDFQRGELEWEGGNLYFNKWSWDMKVEYK